MYDCYYPPEDRDASNLQVISAAQRGAALKVGEDSGGWREVLRVSRAVMVNLDTTL
jgi:hypothetical protein